MSIFDVFYMVFKYYLCLHDVIRKGKIEEGGEELPYERNRAKRDLNRGINAVIPLMDTYLNDEE